MTTHDGCVHRGLRYSAYLRGLTPKAYVDITRNNAVEYTPITFEVEQQIPTKLFGITVCHETQSLIKIIEIAAAKIREYDAALETYAPEEAE